MPVVNNYLNFIFLTTLKDSHDNFYLRVFFYGIAHIYILYVPASKKLKAFHIKTVKSCNGIKCVGKKISYLIVIN